MNTGVVSDVITRTVTLRSGPKAGTTSQAYDLVIDGQKYGHGFKRPLVNVGETVEFEYNSTKYGREISTVRPRSNGAITNPAPQGRKEYKVFPVPVDHGDRSIIRQNSLTNARELVSAYLVSDAVNTSKKGQKEMDEIVDEVIRVAYKFEEYSSGDRERRAADSLIQQENSG